VISRVEVRLWTLLVLASLAAGAQQPPSVAPPAESKLFKVAFVRRVPKVGEWGQFRFEVYVTDSVGRKLKRLGLTGVTPAWSPDGKLLAFCSIEGTSTALYVASADGSSPHRIVGKPFERACAPAWSPDGRTLAFEGRLKGKTGTYTVGLDGSNPTLILADAAAPAWSPDGTQIAVQSARDGNLEIYVADPDGSNLSRLTRYPQEDSSPSWSPDGKRIAFSRAEGDRFSIFFMRADGSEAVRFVSDKHNNLCDPVWAPDGNSILFVMDAPSALQQVPFDSSVSRCVGRPSVSQIMSMNLDGSNLKRLTTERDVSPAVVRASE